VALSVPLGRLTVGRATIQELETQFGSASQPRELHLIGAKLLMCGDVMLANGALEDALAAYRTVQARLLRESSTKLVTLGVRAQINAGGALARLGRTQEAMATCETIDEHGEAALAALAQIRERAAASEQDAAAASWDAVCLVVMADILENLGRHKESQAALTEVIEKYGDDERPLVATAVGSARETWEG
jgi:tetratricopeptide (TPR) repeat protein